MHIAFVEIQNFRKLKAIRVDLHPKEDVVRAARTER